MAEREQKRKQAPARSEDEVVEDVPASSEQGEKIKAELDDLLDEIDEVLESNAEDFVKSYVQKGGQ
jgi:prokaryotic ubiquitin-like protein Pup